MASIVTTVLPSASCRKGRISFTLFLRPHIAEQGLCSTDRRKLISLFPHPSLPEYHFFLTMTLFLSKIKYSLSLKLHDVTPYQRERNALMALPPLLDKSLIHVQRKRENYTPPHFFVGTVNCCDMLGISSESCGEGCLAVRKPGPLVVGFLTSRSNHISHIL